MTESGRRIDRAGETAQVVLVGAVAMAFIIVGLVLVANTVLYTESVGATGSLESTAETAEFQGIARDSTASVVYRVNERNDFNTTAAGRASLDAAVRANVSALSDLLATEYGQEHGVFVDIEPDLSNSEYGSRIEQDTQTFFNNSAGGGDTWTPVGSSTTVAEFQASFNVTEMPDPALPTDRFFLTIDNGSVSRTIAVFNDSGNLSIASGTTAIGSLTTDCTVSTGEFVLVDLQNGSVPGTDCTFGGVNAVEGPVTVTFSNGDAAVGTYSFVVEDSSIGGQAKYANAGGGQPYSAVVYWSVAIDVTYEGPEVGYELSREVPIYAIAPDVSVAPWLTSPASVFFYNGASLSVARGNGTDPVVLTAGLNAEALGPVTTDLTGDGRIDIPYVTSGDEIALTNDTNDTTTLATSADITGTIESTKTRLAADRWNSSPVSVFFVNENHDTIYRVASGGSVQTVATNPTIDDGAQAVIGTANIDADAEDELLFASGSQCLQYLNTDGSKGEVSNGCVGSNNGIGSGSIADFDDDGTDVVVTVDGSNNVVIVGEAESNTELTATNAAERPVTIADVDLDGQSEIVYVGKNNKYLKYVDDVGGSNTIKFLVDGDGNKIQANGGGTGVT